MSDINDSIAVLLNNLVDIIRPLSKAAPHVMRDTINYIENFSPFTEHKEIANGLIQEIESEFSVRRAMLDSGPVFQKNDKVEIIVEIPWWNHAIAAMPKVGITGTVIYPEVPESERYFKEEDYSGLVTVAFNLEDLGYEADPDDPTTSYNMPNWTLRKL